jgi:hypothetical protein
MHLTENDPLDELLATAPVTRRDPVCVRMFHLDCSLRLKLQPLVEMTFPALFDTWRARFDMDSLLKEGIWPFAAYLDASTYPVALAGGQLGALHSAIRAGQLTAAASAPGGIVLGTDVSVHARAGGGGGTNFAHQTDAEGLAFAGRLRLVWNLVRPFAAAGERVVSALPVQMTGLEVTPCASVPSIRQLAQAESEHTAFPEAPEARFVWSIHHTDANQIIYSNAYLARAEDYFAQLVYAARLPIRTLHTRRVRISFKRAFMAGQECVLRGKLYGTASGSIQGVIGFHSADAPGEADPRPAAIARFDACVTPAA